MQLTQIELIRAAGQMGIEVDTLAEFATDNILLKWHNKTVLFSSDGTPLDNFTYQAYEIARNKQLCKRFLKDLGLPFPDSIVFEKFSDSYQQIQSFIQSGQLYVCKPLSGAEGDGVCMNLKTTTDVEAAWTRWNHKYSTFLIEEQKQGSDLRIQAIGGKLVAACHRKPASIIGDGIHSLNDLIKQKKTLIQSKNPANRLEVDSECKQLIARQGLSLHAIPQAGLEIQLKYVANMSQGAIGTDITREIHIHYHEWIERIAKHLNLSIFALDVLTLNYTIQPTRFNAWILEINGKPYWYHHTFTERRQHDMATMILKSTFNL